MIFLSCGSLALAGVSPALAGVSPRTGSSLFTEVVHFIFERF